MGTVSKSKTSMCSQKFGENCKFLQFLSSYFTLLCTKPIENELYQLKLNRTNIKSDGNSAKFKKSQLLNSEIEKNELSLAVPAASTIIEVSFEILSNDLTHKTYRTHRIDTREGVKIVKN